MIERQVWINGEMLPASQAKVSIADRGFQYGDAAFDAMRTYNHRPFRIEDYFDRFFASLKSLGIDPGVTRSYLRGIVEQVLEANLPLITEHEDLQIILRCTRGGDSKARAYRQTQAQAAIRFCEALFGNEYASLMSRAVENALTGERKSSRA